MRSSGGGVVCSSGGGGVDGPSGVNVTGGSAVANVDGVGLGVWASAGVLAAKSMALAVKLVTVVRATSRAGRIRGGLGLMVGLPNGCTKSHY